MTNAVFETKEILNNIDEYISKSQVRVDFLIKELNISTVTYYRKLKNKSFNVDELVKIFSHISPAEYEKWQLNQLLEKGLEDAKTGNLFNTHEVMEEYDSKFLNL